MSLFSYVILYVEDLEKIISFYEKAFDLELRFISEEKVYAELKTENTTLAFATHAQARSNLPYDYDKISPDKPPQGFEIAFTTTDMEKTLNKAIKAGATKVTDSIEKPWGQTICYVRDPEGFLIEIIKEGDK